MSNAGRSQGSGRAWGFVPLLYFMEGVPYVVATAFATLMFKTFALNNPALGLENDSIGFWTTIITIPWTIKMLWGPMVDLTLTKRKWILICQALLAICFFGLGYAAQQPNFYFACLIVLMLMAFVSATHDIAADGFYLLALGKTDQAFFVGIRSTFYRLAMIFGSGYLMVVAGMLEKGPIASDYVNEYAPRYSNPVYAWHDQQLNTINEALAVTIENEVVRAWVQAIFIGGAVFAIGFMFCLLLLPRPKSDYAMSKGAPPDPDAIANEPVEAGEKLGFGAALSEFFKQSKIGWIVMFIIFYRFGESMISKVSALFLKDPVAKGGLGLDTAQIGEVTGVYGVIALLAGGFLGGFLISKFGIKKCLWPMVLALNIPNFAYIYAAATQPGLEFARILIPIDQFGYGFGFSAYMVYLMFVASNSKYKTSNYAVATGLMALGALLAGTISGYLQVRMGYTSFFLLVCLLGIPGVITLFFIPLEGQDLKPAHIELD